MHSRASCIGCELAVQWKHTLVQAIQMPAVMVTGVEWGAGRSRAWAALREPGTRQCSASPVSRSCGRM